MGDLKAELQPAEVDPCFMTLTHFSSHHFATNRTYVQVSWVHFLFVSERWDKNYWVSFLWHLFCYMTHFEGMVSLVSQTPHQMIHLRQLLWHKFSNFTEFQWSCAFGDVKLKLLTINFLKLSPPEGASHKRETFWPHCCSADHCCLTLISKSFSLLWAPSQPLLSWGPSSRGRTRSDLLHCFKYNQPSGPWAENNTCICVCCCWHQIDLVLYRLLNGWGMHET